jgi:parallel beta-helix repeat protein
VASTATGADITQSTIDTNPYGVYATSTNATGTVRASVSESMVVRNATIGLYAYSILGSVVLTARNNTIAANGTGIATSQAASRAWASGNSITDNQVGMASGGLSPFESAGNNTLRNNTVVDTVGTITAVPSATK